MFATDTSQLSLQHYDQGIWGSAGHPKGLEACNPLCRPLHCFKQLVSAHDLLLITGVPLLPPLQIFTRFSASKSLGTTVLKEDNINKPPHSQGNGCQSMAIFCIILSFCGNHRVDINSQSSNCSGHIYIYSCSVFLQIF